MLITEAYHYSPLIFGIFQALVFGAFIIGNMLIKQAMKIFSINKIIFIGLLFTLVGGFSAVFVSYFYVQNIILFIVALMVFSFGAALKYGVLQRVAVEASSEPMGLRMAIFSSCLGIAGVLSSAIASCIYNNSSLNLAYFLAVMTIIAFLLNFIRTKN